MPSFSVLASTGHAGLSHLLTKKCERRELLSDLERPHKVKVSDLERRHLPAPYLQAHLRHVFVDRGVVRVT